MILVSFDIDGTLVGGDPAGPIDFDMVREVQRRGHVIGSSSDRTLGAQRQLWKIAGIEVDFIGHKHHMVATRERFEGLQIRLVSLLRVCAVPSEYVRGGGGGRGR